MTTWQPFRQYPWLSLFLFLTITVNPAGDRKIGAQQEIPQANESPTRFFEQWLRIHTNAKREFRILGDPMQEALPPKQFQNMAPPGIRKSWYKFDDALSKRKRANLDALADDMTSWDVGYPTPQAQFVGPKNVGGRTRALVVDRINPQFVLAGSAQGGLWYSSDGALSWHKTNDQASSLCVTDIIQSSHDATVYYFVTGEPGLMNGFGFPGAGVFRAKVRSNASTIEIDVNVVGRTDEDPRFNYCWCIAESKTDANTLFVGTNDCGLLRTTNGGDRWDPCHFLIDGAETDNAGSVSDVITYLSGEVVAARAGFFRNPRLGGIDFGTLVADSAAGLYHSSDGQYFEQTSAIEYPAEYGRIVLANCQNRPQYTYAVFASHRTNQDGIAGFLVSSNRGRTWIAKNSHQITTAAYGGFCLMLGVHPDNPQSLVCGLSALFSSTDGGEHWDQVREGPIKDYHAFAAFPDGRFLTGNDMGIHERLWTSLGNPVDRNRGYNTSMFYGGDGQIYEDSNDSLRILGGTQDRGAWILPGQLRVNNTEDSTDCYISRQDPNVALMATAGFSVRRTTSFLETGIEQSDKWQNVIFPIRMQTEGFDHSNSYVMSPYNDRLLLCRTHYSLWRSTNHGDDWERITEDIIYAIEAICCRQNDAFFGGKKNDAGAFFRVADVNNSEVGSVEDLSASLPRGDDNYMGYMTAIGEHRDDTSLLFVGFGDQSPHPRVYQVSNIPNPTRDDWVAISETDDGPIPPVYSLQHMQYKYNSDRTEDVRSVLFAGTTNGLYYCVPSIWRWSKVEGVPSAPIFRMKLDRGNQKLFVFTFGRGVWQLSFD